MSCSLSQEHARNAVPHPVRVGGAVGLILAHELGARVSCTPSGWKAQLPLGGPPHWEGSLLPPPGKGPGSVRGGGCVLAVPSAGCAPVPVFATLQHPATTATSFQGVDGPWHVCVLWQVCSGKTAGPSASERTGSPWRWEAKRTFDVQLV